MNRPIKFRAIKKLGNADNVYFTLEDLMRGKVVFAYPEHWHFSEDTGLLDKNGKEIWEGDIVKYREWDAYQDRDEGIREVKIPEFFALYSQHGLAGWQIIGDIFSTPHLLTSDNKQV